MNVVTVIPIKKGFQKENLTYFSSFDVPLGSIVLVPIRKTNVDAIVIEIENARNSKMDIKNREYQLKKVIKIKGNSPFTKNFFEACQRMKNYTIGNTGTIINNLLPAIYLDNISLLDGYQNKLQNENDFNNSTDQTNENIKQEKLIFQALTPDRLAFYRTLIREAFAKKESIYICVPTHFDIEQFRIELTKGIEQYVYSFHGEMPKKILINNYNKCISELHSILIIGTGMFLSIPRHDIKTYILEHESSEAFKQIKRPYIDIRTFIEVLSSINKIKLIFGDTLLRPEILGRHENGELGEIASPLFRLPRVERQIIIDMKDEIDEKGIKKFMVLSETAKKMIEYAISHNESVFLFTVRKGLAGVTVCHDCGNVLLCPNCSTPVVLYGTKQISANKGTTTRIFMCNKCGHKEKTEIYCNKCLSWNLTPLGIGTDKVYEEVKILFPKALILQIDKENTSTDKEALEVINKFNNEPGTILIGNEMAFSYINAPVTHSAIISLDGILSLPSFNITQKILHIIEKLHYITLRNLLIQTRIPDNKILQFILSGNVLPFYREDLLERKQYGYPPYKRLIKITFTGTSSDTEKIRDYIDKNLSEYDPQTFSAFIGKIKGQYVTNTVIKVDPAIWPIPINNKDLLDKDLLKNLMYLSPSFLINVDPEDLL